jgi:hypothetical protein
VSARKQKRNSSALRDTVTQTSESPASGVHPTAPPRELRSEDVFPEARTIPEIGTSSNDLAHTVACCLTALGVNSAKPDAATILSHTIANEVLAIDLVLRSLTAMESNGADVSPEVYVLSSVRDRLSFVSDCAETLATVRATARTIGGAG